MANLISKSMIKLLAMPLSAEDRKIDVERDSIVEELMRVAIALIS
jgi:hypothetical protein